MIYISIAISEPSSFYYGFKNVDFAPGSPSTPPEAVPNMGGHQAPFVGMGKGSWLLYIAAVTFIVDIILMERPVHFLATRDAVRTWAKGEKGDPTVSGLNVAR